MIPTSRNLVLSTAVCVAFVIGFTNSAWSDITGARDAVVVTLDRIYSSLSGNFASDEELNAAAEQTVRKELLPVLDVQRFAKLILAKNWKKATPEQREKFTGILAEFLIRSFVKAAVQNRDFLLDITNKLEVKDAQPGRKEDRAKVSIIVRIDERSTRQVDFRMINSDGVWKLYDVVFEGVSFMINYRAIITAEIKKSSLDEVTNSLEQKLVR